VLHAKFNFIATQLLASGLRLFLNKLLQGCSLEFVSMSVVVDLFCVFCSAVDMYFVVFPEGTRFSTKRMQILAKSQAYAIENDVKPLTQVLVWFVQRFLNSLKMILCVIVVCGGLFFWIFYPTEFSLQILTFTAVHVAFICGISLVL